MINRRLILSFLWCVFSASVVADEGKLLATAGLTQLEGAGGGGIVPWATISGYETQDSYSGSVFSTQVSLDDYKMNMTGVSLGIYDRVELSYAKQTFDLTSLGGHISQDIYGIKTRLYGDLVYSKMPQLSIGLQYKELEDTAIAQLVGANKIESGVDLYLAATKVHLGAIAGHNLVWNLTARATKANQLGLLGFGGVINNDYEIMLEFSAGVFLSRKFALGIEYREKPDNLGLGEDDWKDFFITYVPNKNFNLTLAWADLGSIAGIPKQDGVYLSLTGYLW